MKDPTPKANAWTVSQIGAREHYAVARAFQNHGELRTLFTDNWCRHGRSLLAAGPRNFRSMAQRFHPEIDPAKVESFNLASLTFRARQRLGLDHYADAYEEYLSFGERFATLVTKALRNRSVDSEQDHFFGFFTGCLETLEYLRAKDVFTVVDQADAARVYYQTLADEAVKWPGWQVIAPAMPACYFDRLSAEWQSASAVLVNSNYSRDAIIAQSVASERIIVCPLAFEPPAHAVLAKPPDDEMFFLWLGNVSLGKGIQYLIEAARLLKGTKARFKIAGQVIVSPDAIATAPENIEFIGQLSRDRIGEFLAGGHVFVFPTLSDGFGLAQLEAMAHGLPVIATTHCGQVVTHEVDGLTIATADAHALAAAVEWFLEHRQEWPAMSKAATVKATQFSLERYRRTLLDGVASIRSA